MNVKKIEYNLSKFDEENVETLLDSLNYNKGNYFFTMTKPSILSRILIGNITDFSNRYCIICFSEAEINMIMLSRLSNKKVTEIISINRDEIIGMKLSNVLISFMLNIKLNESNLKFQLFKKFGKFSKVKGSIEAFREMYKL